MTSVLQCLGYLCGAGIAVIMVMTAIFAARSWSLRAFPGPIALPVIGNLWDREAIFIMKFLTRMRNKYGKIFTFWPGNDAFIVVADTKVVRAILTDTKTFPKGPDYSRKFSVVFGEGLVTSNGEQHKRDRSMLSKYFIKSSMAQHFEKMNAQTRRMIDETMGANVGKEMDMQNFFHMCALRIFGSFAAGHDYAEDPIADWICHAVSWGSHVIGEHIVLNIPMWNIIPRVRKLKRTVKKMHAHIDDLIDQRLKKIKAGTAPEDDLMAALLEGNTLNAEGGVTLENLDRKHIAEQFTTCIAAGHDTTAFFCCYMCHLLAANPEVQDRLKHEIQEVMAGRTEVTPDDLARMDYLKCVMQETLRMYTVIPFVNRLVREDMTLEKSDGQKVTFPKGSTVLLPLYLLNRDPEVWEEPNQFRPERFQKIIGHNSAKHGYMPFGYGVRTCIGNQLAMMEGGVMMTQLLQKYRFDPAPGWKPRIMAGISLVSKNGINVVIRECNICTTTAAAP